MIHRVQINKKARHCWKSLLNWCMDFQIELTFLPLTKRSDNKRKTYDISVDLTLLPCQEGRHYRFLGSYITISKELHHQLQQFTSRCICGTERWVRLWMTHHMRRYFANFWWKGLGFCSLIRRTSMQVYVHTHRPSMHYNRPPSWYIVTEGSVREYILRPSYKQETGGSPI